MIRRALFIGIITLALTACGAASQRSAATASSGEVLAAIENLERDPFTAIQDGTFEFIMEFAIDSPDVVVALSGPLFPWDPDDPKYEDAKVLLIAYMAGSVRPQLIKNVQADHPLEGLQLALSVYEKFHAKGILPSIPEYDEWLTFNEEQLKELVEQNKPQ